MVEDEFSLLSDKQIEKIINFVSQNFEEDNELLNLRLLSNYLKKNKITISELDAEELLKKSSVLRTFSKKIVNLSSAIEFINDPSILSLILMSDDKDSDYLFEDRFNKGINTLTLYLNELDKKLLTKEEEKILFKEYKKGNQEAFNSIITHNLKLVVKIASFYTEDNNLLLDLIQEGNLGLIKAAEKFDYTLDYKFSTYAVEWISRYIKTYLNVKTKEIRIPTQSSYRLYRINKLIEKYYEVHGVNPTIEELSEISGLTVSSIKYILNINYSVSSYNVAVNDTDDFTLLDTIKDRNNNISNFIDETFYEQFIEKFNNSTRLNEREKEFLKLHYGDNIGLRELGELKGISKQRVCAIINEALKKIRCDKEIMQFNSKTDYSRKLI